MRAGGDGATTARRKPEAAAGQEPPSLLLWAVGSYRAVVVCVCVVWVGRSGRASVRVSRWGGGQMSLHASGEGDGKDSARDREGMQGRNALRTLPADQQVVVRWLCRRAMGLRHSSGSSAVRRCALSDPARRSVDAREPGRPA